MEVMEDIFGILFIFDCFLVIVIASESAGLR